MTGCGCLLLVAALLAVLYVFFSGSTDAGEPIQEAVALVALIALYAIAIAARRSLQLVARS
jgi:hypothetical protein